MKRILLPAALLLALSGSVAFAQQTAPPAQQAPVPVERVHRHGGEHARDPHRTAMMISKKLNLSADQTAKLEPILADREQKVSALMADTSLAPQDRKKQFHAIHQESQRQLAAILTPDQLQQMKSMHHGHHGPPPPAA